MSLETLAPPPTKQIFACGMLLGASALFTMINLFIYFVLYPQDIAHTPAYDSVTFYMYRVALFPIILCFLISIDIGLWSKYRINYVFIFEIDPRAHLGKWIFMMFSLILYLICMISMFIYIVCATYEARGVPGFSNAWVHPIAMYGVILLFLIIPFKLLFGQIRWWILITTLRCFVAPFVSVPFRDFWYADQLTSLSDVLFQLQFIGCLYPAQLVPSGK
jgi:hypothetical protein